MIILNYIEARKEALSFVKEQAKSQEIYEKDWMQYNNIKLQSYWSLHNPQSRTPMPQLVQKILAIKYGENRVSISKDFNYSFYHDIDNKTTANYIEARKLAIDFIRSESKRQEITIRDWCENNLIKYINYNALQNPNYRTKLPNLVRDILSLRFNNVTISKQYNFNIIN